MDSKPPRRGLAVPFLLILALTAVYAAKSLNSDKLFALTGILSLLDPWTDTGTFDEALHREVVLFQALGKADPTRCDRLNTQVWFSIANPRRNCHSEYTSLKPEVDKCRASANPVHCLSEAARSQLGTFSRPKECETLRKQSGPLFPELYLACANRLSLTDHIDFPEETIEPCRELADLRAQEYCIASSGAPSVYAIYCDKLTYPEAKASCFYGYAMQTGEAKFCDSVTQTVEGKSATDCRKQVREAVLGDGWHLKP